MLEYEGNHIHHLLPSMQAKSRANNAFDLIGAVSRTYYAAQRDGVSREVGPKKTTTKIAQLMLERDAEPSHRLTPDDLSMVVKGVLYVASTSQKAMTYTMMGMFALGAVLLYYN